MSASPETAPIDRIAPTHRPDWRLAGRQQWRDLLFLHWPLPPEALRPLVPTRLALDTCAGSAWVGLVPFAMRAVRPPWLPRPLGLDLLETNVRTYVHLDGRDPGVYFFSLDASSRLAVAVARRAWGLPYHHARMVRHRHGEAFDDRCRRQGPRPAALEVRWRPGETLGAAPPGGLAHFLLERYVLYVERRGDLLQGRVHHPPYPARRAEVTHLEEDLIAAAGISRSAGPAPVAHASAGVDVEVFGPRRC